MDLDDLPLGRVLTRREALVVLGSTGTLFLLGNSNSSTARRNSGPHYPCVVRPASTAGPYYVAEKLNRSDIRSDPADGSIKDGALLALTLSVYGITNKACAPLKNAIVDLWQCDAEGVYSDAVDPRYSLDTTGKKFLRGYQATDGRGEARFTTIYPGWYPTRTPHIHYKLRSPEGSPSLYEFIGQLYFDEAMSDRVYANPPYAARGKRVVSNLTDRIYRSDGGRHTMLTVVPAKEGYAASFEVAIDLG
jgi:protocatechuate 3,4-dioxygenase beta subunit